MASIPTRAFTDRTGQEFVIRTAQPIEKVCLDVFAANSDAIGLYKKIGFAEEGRHSRDIKRGAEDYVDTVTMYRFL